MDKSKVGTVQISKLRIMIEKAGHNYAAYALDLSGCITTGSTLAEAEQNMLEASQLHIDGFA